MPPLNSTFGLCGGANLKSGTVGAADNPAAILLDPEIERGAAMKLYGQYRMCHLNHLVIVQRVDLYMNQSQEKLLSKECGGARESCPIIVGDAECLTPRAFAHGICQV